MKLIDSLMTAVRKFSPKKSSLADVKQNIEPSPPIRLPSEDVLKSYESRYEGKTPPRTPMDAMREPQIPAQQQYNVPPSPISSQYPNTPPYAIAQSGQNQPANPKIDLILAEIETVKAQLKVLSEKLDILESHYRT
ncbi:MAG: hypothetical protein HY515_00515 [Candidatus Aenigmarchaeota archaeon]|nr:hypothetical protein [Candidatus Aenigmarchaeota archaeon]